MSFSVLCFQTIVQFNTGCRNTSNLLKSVICYAICFDKSFDMELGSQVHSQQLLYVMKLIDKFCQVDVLKRLAILQIFMLIRLF